jgi:hypothetical protein
MPTARCSTSTAPPPDERFRMTEAGEPGFKHDDARPVSPAGPRLVEAEQQPVPRVIIGVIFLVGEVAERRGDPLEVPGIQPEGPQDQERLRLRRSLEATISVAGAVNPKTGGNWEGTGVAPDIQTTAGRARDTAYERALQDVIAADGTAAAEARDALAGIRPAG